MYSCIRGNPLYICVSGCYLYVSFLFAQRRAAQYEVRRYPQHLSVTYPPHTPLSPHTQSKALTKPHTGKEKPNPSPTTKGSNPCVMK